MRTHGLDVVIVGAGPAGLSAALLLGRSNRSVLVCDDGEYRNASARSLHGFLTRDGIAPADLRRIGREDLRPYGSVTLREVTVTAAERRADLFEITCADGARVQARKLLLATGVVDALPAISGADLYYGRGLFHCPYCDGYEVRDEPLAAYGADRVAQRLALELTGWSRDVVLCTDGEPTLSPSEMQRLAANGIALRPDRVARLEGGTRLERIVFADGTVLPRRALFFPSRSRQRSDLAARLGCDLTPDGDVETNAYEATRVPGLFVAGDASRGLQLAILAAAEGVKAAFAINTSLLREALE